MHRTSLKGLFQHPQEMWNQRGEKRPGVVGWWNITRAVKGSEAADQVRRFKDHCVTVRRLSPGVSSLPAVIYPWARY